MRPFLLAGYGLLLLLALTMPATLRNDWLRLTNGVVGSLSVVNMWGLWRGPRQGAGLAGAALVLGLWLLYSAGTGTYDECLDVSALRFPQLWGEPAPAGRFELAATLSGLGWCGGLLAEAGLLAHWAWRWQRPAAG